MANKIQVTATTPIDVVLPRQYTEVQTKTAWSDDWQTHKYLEPIRAAKRVAPSMVRAEMRYLYGKIKREDTTALAWENHIDLEGQFCRIRTLTENANPINHFVGVFVDDKTDTKATKTTGADADKPTGDQMPIAYDLTHLIDRVALDKTYFVKGSTVYQVDRLVPYNYRDAASGGIQGNRDGQRRAINGTDTWIHTTETEDGYFYTWNNLQIIQNLLATYSDKLPFTLQLAGQYSALAGIVDAFDPNGKNLLDMINILINRRYGLGWSLEIDGQVVKINVFSIVGTPGGVDIGTVKIPQNTNRHDLVINNAINITQALTVKNVSRKYHRVVCEGDFVKVQSTWSHASGGLENGWTTSDQVDYIHVQGEDAKEKDQFRKADAFRRVWQVYRVPDNWSGGDRNFAPAMVKVSDQGKVDLATASTADPIYRPGKRFLRHLLTTEYGTDQQLEQQKPFAIIQSRGRSLAWSEQWQMAHQVNTDTCNGFHVRLLDTDMAVELSSQCNHYLAKGDWSPTADETEVVPEFEKQYLHLTAAYETDSRIRYTAEIPQAAKMDESAIRTLRLRFPDAQAWYISAGTVTDVTDGELESYTGSTELRNDIDYLEARAKSALAWYSQDRSLLTLSYAGLGYVLPVGTYIVSATHGNQSDPVGTILSSITWDFEQGCSSDT